jgi:hypothetical protein
MDRDRSGPRARAEQLLQEQRYGEAIEGFSSHLRAEPDDPEALLQLGICHLLNRSEPEFLAIHDRAAQTLGDSSELPGRLSRLWALYRSLVAKVTATALVVGAAGACDRAGPETASVSAEPARTTTPAPSEASAAASGTAATVPEPPVPTPAAPATTPTAAAKSTATAGLAPSTKPTATAGLGPSAKPTSTATVAPAHRYSGGVVPPSTKPAHRYSGGVL